MFTTVIAHIGIFTVQFTTSNGGDLKFIKYIKYIVTGIDKNIYVIFVKNICSPL